MFLRSKTAQSTLEYAIVIAVVVAGLLTMQTYVKRGLQGKLRSSTDDIGEQYSPRITTGAYTTTTGSTSNENIKEDGTTTTTVSRGFQNKDGDETVAGFDGEYWPE